jgi:hypothetical protein
MNNDKNICGAQAKSTGKPCQRAPVKGRERCSLHGGHQPRGVEHHNYKSGLYSKYAGSQLKDVLAQLEDVDSEELIRPDAEIKLMQALLMKCNSLEDGLSDLSDLDTISKIIERLIHAKQRSQAIMLEQERLIPATDIQLFLNWMEELLVNRIGESEAMPVMNQLSNFKISDNEN